LRSVLESFQGLLMILPILLFSACTAVYATEWNVTSSLCIRYFHLLE